MGGSAMAMTPPKTASKKRRSATPTTPAPSIASASAIPPLGPSRTLLEHVLRYDGWTLRKVMTLDKARTNGMRWSPPTGAPGYLLEVECYIDDTTFEIHAAGALANAVHPGENSAYRLGILASAERLIGPPSARPREPWDEGYDAATAGAIAMLFILARVNRAKWEATR